MDAVVLFQRRDGYALYVPPDYDESAEWPVVLFLHGAGERGADGLAQTRVGVGPALEKRAEPFPAIVVMPQCPKDDHWTNGCSPAMRALDQTALEFRVDSERVSLTGISMGGAGAWVAATDNPDSFSALAPICGWLGRKALEKLAGILDVPTWVFHGTADDIVPVDASRRAVAALEASGGYVRYTEYAGVGHNSWDRAYQETELLDWLIAHRRRQAL